MKKIIFTLGIFTLLAFVISSCSQNQAGTSSLNSSDTAGFAQFRDWKAMQEEESAAKEKMVIIREKSPVVYTSSGTMSSSTTNEAKTKKKGWSNAAKYGVIGGGTGVVLGAVINKKNRVVGGAVGGTVLGAVGYLLGRAKDKKEGR